MLRSEGFQKQRRPRASSAAAPTPAHPLLVLRHLRRQRLHCRLHRRLALPHRVAQLGEAAVQGGGQAALAQLQQLHQLRALGARVGQLAAPRLRQHAAGAAKQAQEDELRLLQAGVTGDRLQQEGLDLLRGV